jgi:hypothetical protein
MSQLRLDLSHYFDGIKARSKTISSVVKAAKTADKPIAFADPLAADLFNICYQTKPQIMKTNDPNDYNKILRAVAASDGFNTIKKDTQGSLIWSSIGAAVILDELSRQQDNPPKGDYPDGGDNGDGDPNDSGNENDGDDIGSNDKRNSVDQAVAKAKERLEDLKDGLGGKSVGRGNTLPTFADAAIESEQLVKLLANRRLSQLLKRVGRMRRHATFLPSLDVLDASEVTDINVGRNLPSVLPHELALLTGTEEEFRIFTEKYNNSELQQFKTKGATRSGEGPLIVCIDASGSMGMITEENSPLSWAASVAAAAYITSLKKKRAFAAIYFSDDAIRFEPTKQGTFDPDFFSKILRGYGGGGTDFESAWQRVIEMMKKSGSNNWRKADVLFITDGDGYIHSDWLKDKAKYSTRLFSFFVGRSAERMQRSALAKRLGEFSDMLSFLPVLDINAAEVVNETITRKKQASH